MLILTRRTGEITHIGKFVKLYILGVKGSHVRIGFEAPANISIIRDEVLLRDGRDDSREERADSGPYAGHLYTCHVFQCDGCHSHPADYCNCGHKLWADLIELIRELIEVSRADEVKGGGDPASIPEIEAQLSEASAKLENHIEKMKRELTEPN